MADDVDLIIQLPAGSLLDRQLREDPPPSVASGRAVIESLPADPEGRIVPPEGGEVVLSFLSPEALRREAETVMQEVSEVEDDDQPPVVVLQVVVVVVLRRRRRSVQESCVQLALVTQEQVLLLRGQLVQDGRRLTKVVQVLWRWHATSAGLDRVGWR